MVSSLRRRIPPAAWLLLLVAALIPFGLLAPTAAYTAEPNRMTITSVEPIPADLAFEHGSRIAVNTGTGNIAYCAQGYLRISQAGATFTRYGSLGIPELDYVMYHGYDGEVVTSIYGLDALKSQVATTAAVWLAIGEQRSDVLGITTSTGTYFHGNQYAEGRYELIYDAETKAAAWQLYQDALAYKQAGAGGLEAGCAVYWAPDERLVDGVFRQGLVTANKAIDVQFTKTSADASMTSGNAEYAYGGATYAIYNAQTGEHVTTITTDDDGHASCALPYGSYYAQETAAPKGFTVSPEPVTFTVDRGTASAQVDLPDTPASVGLAVQKQDSATGGPAQAGATLEGAEYKLTDANGNVHIATSDEDGRISFTGIPLGALSVVETATPEGYMLDTTVHEYYASANNPNIDGGVITLTDTYPEDVIAFDIEIAKTKGTDDPWDETDGHAEPAVGVRFEVVSNTTGEVVGTLTTDADGFASTRDDATLWFGAGTRPEGVGGAIPYDAAGYTVREDPETIPEGFDVVDSWQITPEQMAAGAQLRYSMTDEGLSTRLQIVKLDAATGQRVPLADFSFQILDEAGSPVSMTTWYPNEETIDTFTTGDDGTVTLPERLAPGTYAVHEVATVAPYLLADNVSFTVSADHQTATPQAVVEVADAQAMGIARIEKACVGESGDHDGSCSLEGAEFDVLAVGDIVSPDGTVHAVDGEVVAHVVTDEEGCAETPELWLGTGSATYAFVETVSPAGHVLDSEPHEFTLSFEDAETNLVYTDVTVENTPTETLLDKRIMGTDEPLAGATFELWSADDELRIDPEDGRAAVAIRTDAEHAVALALETGSEEDESASETAEPVSLAYDESAQAFTARDLDVGYYALLIDGERVGTVVTVPDSCSYSIFEQGVFSLVDHLLTPDSEPISLVTDTDGMLRITHLTAGSYRIAETAAPDGYLVDRTTRYFTIDGNGMTEGMPSYSIAVEDDYTKVELSKRDITDESEVPGATLTLLDSEGTIIDSWVSRETPHRIDALAPGDYTLVEEMTPHDYEQATAVEFTVAATGEIQTVTMYDEPIEVSGEVDKRQEIADPVVEGIEPNGDGANRAAVSVSDDGSYMYSIDVRSTSTTWVDEFTVTDELTAAADGRANLIAIVTPQVAGDYDGKLNVWYRTIGEEADGDNDQGEVSESATSANATLSDGHVNPWITDESTAETLGGDGRAVDYTGWRLWASDVDATTATELAVSDLDLADGERIVGVRLEYGRVEAGFTSRLDDWGRDDLKDVHDDCDDIPLHPAEDGTEDAGSYSPLVLHMQVTDEYVDGTPLHNGVRLDLFRNGGNTGETTGLEDHDEDEVMQEARSRIEQLAQTGAAIATPTLTTGAFALMLPAAWRTLRRR